MKRSIVELSMPQHYRDSSLSSLESILSDFSSHELVTIMRSPTPASGTIDPYQQQPPHYSYSSEQEYNPANVFLTMQDEYSSSRKQPTPGTPKMARILASSSPEITALCRKSFASPAAPVLPPLESKHGISKNEGSCYKKDATSEDNNIISNNTDLLRNDSRNNSINGSSLKNDNVPPPPPLSDYPFAPDDLNDSFSSDSSCNLSMSSSSMESHSLPPVNHKGIPRASWGNTPPPAFIHKTTRIASKKNHRPASWIHCGNHSTAPTAATSTAESITTTTTTAEGSTTPLFVSVGRSSPPEDDGGLNYSGSDIELDALTQSLHTISLFQPEPWRACCSSSFASLPDYCTSSSQENNVAVNQGHIRRPSFHRRISYDQLPSVDMILNDSFGAMSTAAAATASTQTPPQGPRSVTDLPLPIAARCSSTATAASAGSASRRHRRNTTQIIMHPSTPTQQLSKTTISMPPTPKPLLPS